MRRLVLVLFLALVASLSQAAFDLQTLQRYKASALCTTQMTHITKGPGLTSYVAGQLSNDAFVAQYDRYGTLMRFAIWDSASTSQDFVRALEIGGDGGVHLFIRSDDSVSVVKFSPTLSQVWERTYPTGGANLEIHGEVSDQNLVYVLTKVAGGTDLQVRILDSNGTQTANITHASVINNIYDVDAFPSPESGIVVAGMSGDVGVYALITSAADIPIRGTIAAVPTLGNGIYSCVCFSNGTVWMAGARFDSTWKGFVVQRGGPFYESPNFTRFLQLTPTGPTSARVIGETFGPSTILSITNIPTAPAEQPGMVSTSSVNAFVDLPNLNRTWAARNFASTSEFFDLTSNASVGSNPNVSAEAIAKLDDGTAMGIRSLFPTSELSLFDAYGFTASTQILTGAPYRTISEAIPQNDGSLVVLITGQRLGIEEAIVARYRMDGTLAWARGLSIPGVNTLAVATMTQTSEGNFVVMGRAGDLSTSPLGYARLNANGAVQDAKTINFPAPPRRLFAGPNGEVYALALRSSILLSRLSPTGQIVWTKSLGGGADNGPYDADLRFLPNGKIALNFSIDDVVDSTALYQINPADGFIDYSTSIAANTRGTSMTLDASGNPIIAVQTGTSLVFRKRSASNLATQLASASFPNVDILADMKQAPNGKLIVAVSTTSSAGYEIRNVAANFGSFTTSVVEPTVTSVFGLAVDGSNQVYLLGMETPTLNTRNTYAAKYLATGARSAQRRIAGRPFSIHTQATAGVWIAGDVPTRKQGNTPYVARYSP